MAIQNETGAIAGRFVKGKSGNPKGRPAGIKQAQIEASYEWRELLRGLLLSKRYQEELERRLLAGELPPIVEAKLFAYAFGEAPKAPDERQVGMVVNLGFLGFLQEGASTPGGALVPASAFVPPPRPDLHLADAHAIEVVEDPK